MREREGQKEKASETRGGGIEKRERMKEKQSETEGGERKRKGEINIERK